MRKYYTRPCNFYYGNYAKKLIKKKKALSLAGNPNIAFDQLEIFQRKKKEIVQNIICPISEIKTLSEEITSTIKADLEKAGKYSADFDEFIKAVANAPLVILPEGTEPPKEVAPIETAKVEESTEVTHRRRMGLVLGGSFLKYSIHPFSFNFFINSISVCVPTFRYSIYSF